MVRLGGVDPPPADRALSRARAARRGHARAPVAPLSAALISELRRSSDCSDGRRPARRQRARRNRWDAPRGHRHPTRPRPPRPPRPRRWRRAKAQQAAPALDAAAISASVQSALAAAQQRAAALGTPSRAAANAPGGLNASTARMPTTVTLDAQGRLLDEHGKVIRSTGGVQSAKINQRETTNPLLEAAAPPDVTDNPYFDPRMAAPGHAREQRRKRAFNFVEEGRFSRKADDLRAKAAVEQLLREAKTKGGRKDISHPAPGEQLGVISQRPAVAVSAATLTSVRRAARRRVVGPAAPPRHVVRRPAPRRAGRQHEA